MAKLILLYHLSNLVRFLYTKSYLDIKLQCLSECEKLMSIVGIRTRVFHLPGDCSANKSYLDF